MPPEHPPGPPTGANPAWPNDSSSSRHEADHPVDPPDSSQLGPADEPVPLLLAAAPQPPGPGFWMSLVWSLIFVMFLNGIVLIVLGVGLVLAVARNGSPEEFLEKVRDPAFQTSEEFYSLVADALAPAMLLGELASIAFALGILRLLVGREWRRSLSFRRPGVAQSILVLLGLPGMIVLSSGIHQAASQVLPSFGDANFTLLKECFRRWPPWFGVLVIGLGPGIGEELWCRGFLGRGLIGRYGYFSGVLLTSFFFGLMHLDPPHAVATAMMGICLHLTYLATRSLWVPILVHILNNSLGVAEAMVQSAEVPGPSNPVAQALMYATSFLLLVAVGWALYQCRTRVVIATEAGWMPWTGPYPGVEFPPGACRPRALHPWPSKTAAGMTALALFVFGTTIYLNS